MEEVFDFPCSNTFRRFEMEARIPIAEIPRARIPVAIIPKARLPGQESLSGSDRRGEIEW